MNWVERAKELDCSSSMHRRASAASANGSGNLASALGNSIGAPNSARQLAVTAYEGRPSIMEYHLHQAPDTSIGTNGVAGHRASLVSFPSTELPFHNTAGSSTVANLPRKPVDTKDTTGSSLLHQSAHEKHTDIPIAGKYDELSYLSLFFASQNGWPRFSSLCVQPNASSAFNASEEQRLKLDREFPRLRFRSAQCSAGLVVWVEPALHNESGEYLLPEVYRELLNTAAKCKWIILLKISFHRCFGI